MLLCSCGGGGGAVDAPTEFTLTQTTPRDEAEDIPLVSEINLVFSHAVDPASLTADSFRVVVESGDTIPGNRLIPPLNRSLARFLPQSGFLPFAIHTVRVTREVRDTTGRPLDREYTFEFQTEPSGPVLPDQSQVEDLGNLLKVGRWFHRMTLLPSNRFLITGGYAADNGLTGFAENLVPALRQSFLIPATMVQPRAGHVQVPLLDGRLLIAGGEVSNVPFVPIAACEIFDPATFRFEVAASMGAARSFASAVRLSDGRVLVSGGQSLGPGGAFLFRDDAEIYDPVAGTWTPAAGPMAARRSHHGSFLLASTDVLVMGGTPGRPSAELWDPFSGSFAPLIGQGTFDHYLGAATTLPDGRPFMAGGLNSLGVSMFDPSFGFVGAINTMFGSRAFATATALRDGRVFLAGGTDFGAVPALLHETIDVFFPIGQTGKILRVPGVRLPVPTSHHAAALDPDGNLWLVGGLPTASFLPGLRQVTVLHPG